MEFQATYKNPCPQCRQAMLFVGQAFRAPKMSDVRTWQRLEKIFAGRSEPLLDARRLFLRHDDRWYARD